MNKHIIATTFVTLFAAPVMAKDSVVIEERFTVDSDSRIQFEIPVGKLDLQTHDSDEVIIEVKVKDQEDNWFASPDLDEVYLDKRVSGNRVILEIDANDTIQDWEVYVPKSAHIDVSLGVGEVDLEDLTRDIFVEVGVGEVDIRLGEDDYGRIELESGVGAADLSGFKNIENERHFISESSNWRGAGRYDILVEVGVGDVDVDY
ncbi:MAG: hypothetical protein ACFHVJ_13610 [Aestuariibacter sp.]